ncbi:MAG: hypothetical protein JRG88_09745 [Deltaproteobacteria bacterium]|nr:hypothetical protein [Deltaproteobacteria bacterium]
MKPCDQNIKETFHLAERMIRLADKGDVEREDVGCGILYGVLRSRKGGGRKIPLIFPENT